MSKDDYSCIFPKLKVVCCLYYPSNISSHSERSGETKQNTKQNTSTSLVISGTAFSTSFPDFFISILKKNAPFRSLFARRGLLACADVVGSRVTCHA